MPGSTVRRRKAQPPGCFTKIWAMVAGCCDAFVTDQLPGDPPNRLKVKDHRHPGKVKAMAQSPSVSLAKLKEVAAVMENCTINDVLMCLVTMTLQAYFEKHEPKTLQQKVRANFPISLRKQGADVMEQGQ